MKDYSIPDPTLLGLALFQDDQAAEQRSRLKMIEDILGDDYDLDHLRELMTAEREGRLYVRPPFQVGDTLYLLITTFNSYEMREATITGFRAGKNYQYVTYRLNKPPYFESSVKVDELGKIAFLSQEEAEAALEKMKEENEP